MTDSLTTFFSQLALGNMELVCDNARTSQKQQPVKRRRASVSRWELDTSDHSPRAPRRAETAPVLPQRAPEENSPRMPRRTIDVEPSKPIKIFVSSRRFALGDGAEPTSRTLAACSA